ncbi:molybdenum ABC transporter ATP-binding protein [Oceanicella actignis]|uniref:Molybdate transport system ATP-binding protein n=1 Tax=Oceanicella actignis TaxID=1189325 RepID=A0A1M7SIA3_9RHOB|nr:molybdenum ABC transporter ATP-binding protein [Oceanicella actignis]SET18116.1 molybdate transport system ATP-binding protein [Oceanicella actignis]SHN58142.1 molybdate transport system ATP-binding protein [Oceanicella actignis]
MTLEVEARLDGPAALDAAFAAAPGSLLALVGPSGAGKTTLLRAIAGLTRPAAGRIAAGGETWFDSRAGVDVPAHRRRVGMVFQSYALFPHMSAARNVAAALDLRPRAAAMAEARRLLAQLGLGELAERRPDRMSGGQRQRVALARALARRPRALLLDEPFSAVDRAARAQLHARVAALRDELGAPIVLVTHDLNEAQLLADRMAVLAEGRIVAQGPTDIVMADPAAMRALGLREAAALLPARVARHEADGLTRLEAAAGPLWLPRIDAPEGARVRVRIMAHDVIVSRARPEGLSAANILPATVLEIRPGEGPGALVTLDLAGDRILARLTRRAVAALALAPGTHAHAVLKAMSVARDHVALARD